jgi:hypothetical protein
VAATAEAVATAPRAAADAAGWLCFPAANRFLAFDGALLHGVVPPKVTRTPAAAAAAEPVPPPRVTLMLGWWGAGVRQSAKPSSLPSATLSYYAGPAPFAGGTPVTAMQSLADLILPGGGDAGDEGDGGAFELSEIIASSDEEMLLQGAMEGSFVEGEEEEDDDDEEEEEEEEEEGEDDAEGAEDLDGVFECEFDCGLRGTQAEVEAHELGATVKTCVGLARRAERTRRKAGLLTPAAAEGDEEEDEEDDEEEHQEEDEAEGDGEGDDEYADEDDEDEDDEGLVLGPNMPMDRSFRWLDEEFFGAHLLHDDGHRPETGTRNAASAAASAVGPRAVALEHVPRVWAPVGHSSGSPPRPASAAEVAFVGRWFVGHPADIDREVLSARAPPPQMAAAAGAVPAFMSIADALAARQ